MPNLNKIAKEWADQRENAFFVPLGLKHRMVTAGIVKVASQMKEPEQVWVATSTGVLTRGLQIAWPNAKFVSVAVSRNMKAGELGRAQVISEKKAFTQPESKENLPPFPNIATYDGKVWKFIPKYSDKDILFWNVGKEPELEDEGFTEPETNYSKVQKGYNFNSDGPEDSYMDASDEYNMELGYELGEQDDGTGTGESDDGAGAGTASVGVWDSGIARGIANQLANTKWSDSYQPSRGKANPMW